MISSLHANNLTLSMNHNVNAAWSQHACSLLQLNNSLNTNNGGVMVETAAVCVGRYIFGISLYGVVCAKTW